jgi:hypothetical protein
MRKRMGRPPKPEEEKFVARSIRFPPALWEAFSELVPEGQRSGTIQRLVEREVKRLQRSQASVRDKNQTLRIAEPGGENDHTDQGHPRPDF